VRKLWVVSVAVRSGCVLAACGGGSSSNSSGTNSGSTAGKAGSYKVGWGAGLQLKGTAGTSRASTPRSTSAQRWSASRVSRCYENLDKTLMSDVVPWVPYLWSFAQHVTAPTSRSGSSTSSAARSGMHVAVK